MAASVRGDTDEWPSDLGRTDAAGDKAIGRLHELLLRVTRSEVRRRSGVLRITGPELDDLAQQAADDATMAILRKLDLVAAVRRAVKNDLTDHQRQVFVAIVLNGVPLDAVVLKLGSTRNAVYKTMFDARRKLRAVLDTNGHLDDEARR